jgi:BMFP domain-containing protein YqiC
MQTKNPMFDELAQLMTNAMGAAQGVGEEAQAMFRAQAERFIADMDLVGRDELDAMKARAEAAEARLEELEERLKALEGKGASGT